MCIGVGRFVYCNSQEKDRNITLSAEVYCSIYSSASHGDVGKLLSADVGDSGSPCGTPLRGWTSLAGGALAARTRSQKFVFILNAEGILPNAVGISIFVFTPASIEQN